LSKALLCALFVLVPCVLAAIQPPTTPPPPCVTSAQVLLYGNFDEDAPTGFLAWLQTNIPTGHFTAQADCNTPGCFTAGSWNSFNLVIIGYLSHTFNNAEQNAVYAYLNQGGVNSIIALAGYLEGDYPQQQSVFGALGVTYNPTFIGSVTTEILNPLSPLTPGISFMDFNGGYGSTPYLGSGSSQYIITSGSDGAHTVPLGQTITLPSGGRIVVWGDEWITYTSTYEVANSYGGAPKNQDDLFWKNAINWAGVCVPGAPNNGPCPSNCSVDVVGVSCQSATVSTSGLCVSLSMTDTSANAKCSN